MTALGGCLSGISAATSLFQSADSGMVFKVAPPSVAIIQELLTSYGAIVTGRRDFEVSKAWGGKSRHGCADFYRYP